MKYITMYFHIPLLIIIIAITMSFEYKYIYLYSNQHYSSTNIWLQIISLNITIRYITDIIITYFTKWYQNFPFLETTEATFPTVTLAKKENLSNSFKSHRGKLYTYIWISCKICIKNPSYDLPSAVLSKKETPFNGMIFSVTM